jgi:type IV pilus assembly protein PilC
MIFSATVTDKDGARRTLAREAASEREALAALRAEGFAVLSIAPAAGADAEGARSLPPPWHPAWLVPMRAFDVELGLRQLSSMLRSGVSLLAALETVADQASSPRAARVWRAALDDVASGRPLSEALAARGGRFGPAAIALVRVGEQSGELDAALLHAAGQLEAHRNLRSMLANALAYPVFAIVAALGVSAFLVVSVIPKIAEFLESGGAELPALTQALVDLSAWLRANGAWLLGGLAAAVAAFLAVRLFPAGRLALDSLALRTPVAGRVRRLAGTAVFARAMGMLAGSGVGLLEALDVSRGLLRNRRLARCVGDASEAVLRGGALAPPLKARGCFMPMLSQMVAVGETTGSLADAFSEAARFHELVLAVAIKRLGALVEPLMIVFTGLVVGVVYVSFFMALFSMAGMS